MLPDISVSDEIPDKWLDDISDWVLPLAEALLSSVMVVGGIEIIVVVDSTQGGITNVQGGRQERVGSVSFHISGSIYITPDPKEPSGPCNWVTL